MSIEMVSKFLELDADPAPSKTKKKSKHGTNDVMSQIKTDRHGVWKELKKLKKSQTKATDEKRKKKKFKSAMEIYKEENNQDFTEENVEALQRVSQLGKVEDKVAEKILFKLPYRLSKDIVIQEKEEESSVFTEEDFLKFEKEYKPKRKRK